MSRWSKAPRQATLNLRNRLVHLDIFAKNLASALD